MDPEEWWTLHIDGSSSSSRPSSGLILACLEGEVVEYTLQFAFPIINNRVEYEALLAKIKIAKELKVGHLSVYSDSKLVVG